MTDELLAELKARCWKTRGARFAAHRRLTRRHAWSTWAISMLSVYLIAGSAVALLVEGESARAVNVFLLSASVLVLVLSLIEASMAYQIRAERLHACAVALTDLELELVEVAGQDAGAARDARVVGARERYARITKECPENHSEADYDAFRARHRKDFQIGWWRATSWRLQSEVSTWGAYLVAIFSPVAFALILYLR